MRFYHRMIGLAGLAFLPCAVFAAGTPSNVPTDLLYQNRPIDPQCFDREELSQPVALNHCGIAYSPQEKISGENEDLVSQGFFGYEYTWTDDKDKNLQSQGYRYYRFFGKDDNSRIIFLVSGGGGSGQFSSLLAVKRIDDELKLAVIAGGDRCNNGIFDVQQTGDAIHYKMHMTAMDFLDLSKQNPHHLRAYDDLASCAACCEASANFVFNPHFAKAPLKLESVDLSDSNKIAQGKYYGCFQTIIQSYIGRGKTLLNTKELIDLAKEFNAQCVK